MIIKFINSFRIGWVFIKQDVFKPFFKWTGIILAGNGCYTIGKFEGMTIPDNSVYLTKMSKFQYFCYYIWELRIGDFIYAITHNIAYYLKLPINIVFGLIVIFTVFILLILFYKLYKIIYNKMFVKPLNSEVNKTLGDYISNVANTDYMLEAADRKHKQMVERLKKDIEKLKMEKKLINSEKNKENLNDSGRGAEASNERIINPKVKPNSDLEINSKVNSNLDFTKNSNDEYKARVLEIEELLKKIKKNERK